MVNFRHRGHRDDPHTSDLTKAKGCVCPVCFSATERSLLSIFRWSNIVNHDCFARDNRDVKLSFGPMPCVNLQTHYVVYNVTLRIQNVLNIVL